ncbi:MAG: nucleotidyltransferase family protein [Phycisphaerales bacterium]|nr:nucleotidyltransferase family protein [Phycisphaerales bacterium]
MESTLPISIPNDRIAEFCMRNRVRRLSLFGSVLREDFTPTSDIDILVEFEPGTRIGFFGFQGLEDELSALLGRRVDLNTPNSLSRYFRDQVLREARTLHVAA